MDKEGSVHINFELTEPGTLPQTDREIHDEIARAYANYVSVKNGAVEQAQSDLTKSMLDRNTDVPLSTLWSIVNGQGPPPELQNNHPLTQEQYEDLKKGILIDFGPPIIDLLG